jgi:hypothetical protein
MFAATESDEPPAGAAGGAVLMNEQIELLENVLDPLDLWLRARSEWCRSDSDDEEETVKLEKEMSVRLEEIATALSGYILAVVREEAG